MAVEDVVVTGVELAAFLGCRPSYIVELKRNGRLVPAAGGKGYLKGASLALYEQTRDPARAGVASRHAAERGQSLTGAEVEEERDDEAEDAIDVPERPLSSDAKRKAKALADKAELDADNARIDMAERLGELLPRVDVERAIGQAANGLRVALENMADTLAPQLAATNHEAQCRKLVWDEVSHALEELSRGFREAAKAAEASS